MARRTPLQRVARFRLRTHRGESSPGCVGTAVSDVQRRRARLSRDADDPSAPRPTPAPFLFNALHSNTSSCRRIESPNIAVTRRVLTGFLPDAPVGGHGILNGAATREAQMDKAVRGAEEVFMTYAHASSRARDLSTSASDAEWSPHRATYVGSCTAARIVGLLYQSAESFSAIVNAHVAVP